MQINTNDILNINLITLIIQISYINSSLVKNWIKGNLLHVFESRVLGFFVMLISLSRYFAGYYLIWYRINTHLGWFPLPFNMATTLANSSLDGEAVGVSNGTKETFKERTSSTPHWLGSLFSSIVSTPPPV